MFQILGCITVDHDIRLVMLAAIVCLFTSFTAIGSLTRARFAQGRMQAFWIAGTGTITGCGVWATHFVAMLAYKNTLAISYDISLTGLSIVIAIAVATLGIAVAIRLHSGLSGGIVVGAAVALMHYVGMAALHGPVAISWQIGYVAASIVLGTTLAAIGLSIAMRGTGWRHTALAAGTLTLSICSLHFTAMTAVTLTPIAAMAQNDSVLEPMSLAFAIAAIAVLIIGLGLVGTLVDGHLSQRALAEAERLREHIVELEVTKRDLESTTTNLSIALAAAAAGSQAKSQFLAAMSHELRTPLNAIIGYSDLLRTQIHGPLGDDRYCGFVGDIHSSGAHLLALINDILDLARLDANRVALDEDNIDVSHLIDETLRVVAPQAQANNLMLERDIPPHLPRLQADRRRLKQVLLNLLSNAVKFTPSDGSVRISVEHSASGLLMVVADTGIGMRPEDIPTALDRFGQIDSTLARKYEGTGLGLPLAKQLVEIHGGMLSIESSVGEGTTVTVTMPRQRLLEGETIASSRAATSALAAD